MPKLADLFVGVLDFFAMLLPGAIATAMLIAYMKPLPHQPVLRGLLLVPAGEAAGWVMFSVASYFLGHLVFMFGSWLDSPFHKWRRHIYPRRSDTSRPRNCRNLRAHLAQRWRRCRRIRGLLRDARLNWQSCFPPRGTDKLFEGATRIRDSFMPQKDEQKALNTFQWARSVLMEGFPAAASDIHRLEADSKFFRSLVVLGLIVAVHLLGAGHAPDGFVVAILTSACIVRYASRRLKSERQAFIHILSLHALGLLSPNRYGQRKCELRDDT